MAPAPLNKRKIVKKRTKAFVRFQCHGPYSRGRVKEAWRKPRGIDSAVRRRFRNYGPIQPRIGFGSDKRTKYLLPNGFYPFVIHNVKELDMLLMHNQVYAAIIGHAVGGKKRAAIVERAAQLNIKVMNRKARLTTEETE
uniref:Ribosomal protein L32 n=1 Tax=Oxyrrhis marina TaxID=2969 RepID=A0A6U9KRC3_OXYMA|mmetsp:Transcript_2407/g.3683  ORF Transcript_2407/g.3683 Transcript_2407/m.3683 type:complete len:139 (-) Transcript_2407:63-479(-)